MKFLSTLAVALTVALPVLAQDLAGLPACAQQPTLAGIGSTGCALADLKCICSAKSFITGLAAELPKSCSAADIAKTDAFALKFCASAGVTLDIPGGAGSSSGSSSAGVAPTSTSASSTSAAISAASSAPASTTSAAPSESSSESADASGTHSGSPAAASGAATQVRAGVIGVIAVGMGVIVGL